MAIDPLSLGFGRDKEFCVYLYRDPRHKRPPPIYVGAGKTKTRPDTPPIIARARAALITPVRGPAP